MNDRTPPPWGATPEENPTLDAYLDGELDGAARAAFESALATDANLAASLEAHAALDAQLRAALSPRTARDAEIVAAVLDRGAAGGSNSPATGPAPFPRAPSVPRPPIPWLGAVALAASILFVIRLGPGPEAPVAPFTPGAWQIANDRGLAVWIPAGVPKKVPVSTPLTLDLDGELATLGDSGVALRTPQGGDAFIAPGSMVRFDDGVLTVLHGSIWVRGRGGSSEEESVWLGSKSGGIEVRGRGSFSISDVSGAATIRAHRGLVQVEEGTQLAHSFSAGALPLAGKGVPAVEPDRLGLVAVGWAAALVDRGAALDGVLLAHAKALADPKLGEVAAQSLADHFGREAVPVLRDALLAEVDEPAESSRRWFTAHALRRLLERGVLGESARPDRAARRTIESLFTLPVAADRGPGGTPVLEEVLHALAAATGVGPVPTIEAWLEKIEPERRRDFLEKWRAVWRHRLEAPRRD